MSFSREAQHASASSSNMDPERLIQCPYDKSHEIRASRFPYHLVKCRQNNPKIAKNLVTCPYNARHRIPKPEFKMHLERCENKIAPEVCEAATVHQKESSRAGAFQGPPSKEDWEADAEHSPIPFVFGSRETACLWRYKELSKNIPLLGSRR